MTQMSPAVLAEQITSAIGVGGAEASGLFSTLLKLLIQGAAVPPARHAFVHPLFEWGVEVKEILKQFGSLLGAGVAAACCLGVPLVLSTLGAVGLGFIIHD